MALKILFRLIPIAFTFTVSATVKNLRCEYLTDPIGVDEVSPRLSWTLPDAKSRITVAVAEDSTTLSVFMPQAAQTKTPPLGVYTFTCTPGTAMMPLTGMDLQPATRYFWGVSVGAEYSAIASFTTDLGLGDASWISDGHDANHLPLAKYRHTFDISKTVAEAYIAVASAGLHELSLNGCKVGDHRLDPMYTRFDRRILSVMYDLKHLLRDGSNQIIIELGNGWYNHQSTAVWSFHEASWRNRPRFAARLLLRYTDGTEENIVTDSSWQTAESSTVFSSIYTAEHYDATLDSIETEWAQAIEQPAPTPLVSSQMLHPIRCTAIIPASHMERISDTLVVYHFPKNMAGVTRLRVKGPRGTVLRLKHGEMLYPDGRVNTANIDYHYRPTDDSDPFQTDIVTLSGGNDEFAARFGYKGFQYVEVSSSLPVNLSTENLIAEEMHSDVPRISNWHSSSPYLDSLLEATNNSYLSNLFGYPTDCPQREKNGWTADAYLALETGMSSFDVITVYEKWLADFRDEQRPDGTLPCIIPTDKWGYDWANGVDWTSATVIIPWQLYCYYGDTRLLERHYDCMAKYVKHIEKAVAIDNMTDWGLGDWIPVKTTSDLRYTTSIYYHVDAAIMAKVAALLGKTDDAIHYTRLADDVRNAINDAYLNREKGIYAGGSQTELAMALYWGIVPDDMRDNVAASLNEVVVDAGYHLDVGVHGCKALLGALTDNGYADTAYKVVTNTTYPSWGYWIRQGATTLHENWKTDVIIDNSLNHIMFGEVGAWLFKGLAGITPSEDNPGFRHVNIRPFFPDGLNSLDVERDTPFGSLSTSWHRTDDGRIHYTVSIPEAMTAHITLPDGTHRTFSGKTLTFNIK